MPIMNGNELCTKLINLNPNLKVFLMSACPDLKYDKEKILFVNKPISIARLIELTNEQLQSTAVYI